MSKCLLKMKDEAALTASRIDRYWNRVAITSIK